MTTTEQALEWFNEGEEKGMDWMLLVRNAQTCHVMPVYVSPNRSLDRELPKWRKIYRVIAVYDLNRGFSRQSDSWKTDIWL